MSKKILQLISEDFEDLEVWYPVYRCREEGWQVDFAAEKPGLYHGKRPWWTGTSSPDGARRICRHTRRLLSRCARETGRTESGW